MNPKVLKALETSRNPHEIHHSTGVSLSEIRNHMRLNPSELAGWGRPEMQRHIISRRRASAFHWPTHHSELLIDHKRLHDQGRVNMCQGRDGDWIIQYAVSNHRVIQRPAYFYGG